MSDIRWIMCKPCEAGHHDGCDNTAEDPDDGGLTSCFCPCWNTDEADR